MEVVKQTMQVQNQMTKPGELPKYKNSFNALVGKFLNSFLS
jgi:hypothetical protein